jgi:hypothetical protein
MARLLLACYPSDGWHCGRGDGRRYDIERGELQARRGNAVMGAGLMAPSGSVSMTWCFRHYRVGGVRLGADAWQWWLGAGMEARVYTSLEWARLLGRIVC